MKEILTCKVKIIAVEEGIVYFETGQGKLAELPLADGADIQPGDKMILAFDKRTHIVRLDHEMARSEGVLRTLGPRGKKLTSLSEGNSPAPEGRKEVKT